MSLLMGHRFLLVAVSGRCSDLALEPNLKLADRAAIHADPRQRMPAMNIEIAACAQKSRGSEFV